MSMVFETTAISTYEAKEDFVRPLDNITFQDKIDEYCDGVVRRGGIILAQSVVKLANEHRLPHFTGSPPLELIDAAVYVAQFDGDETQKVSYDSHVISPYTFGDMDLVGRPPAHYAEAVNRAYEYAVATEGRVVAHDTILLDTTLTLGSFATVGKPGQIAPHSLILTEGKAK